MKVFYSILTMFLLLPVAILAQEEGENSGFEQYSSDVFDKKENALNLVSNMNKPSGVSETLTVNPGILIEQIGDYNIARTNLVANTINFSLVQNGNSNFSEISKAAENINQAILQNGNNNTISDLSLYTTYDVNMQLIQNGENQSIQNYGTNSLSKNMTVTQSGNGASVIIINQ
ncbi:hypothetical protein GV828_08575 [Flavobacterium sp. NST-5]|uniref:Curlin n=1 Tax=Flavobacterium ichthyis TaxID=2698827 RepID=A0ABW9ZD52_9FLAO|nr:hypothetical protein [Flavobacterium ichthyis]NBL65247.1 hypothetical protein [Flavobacterium ichthyis]